MLSLKLITDHENVDIFILLYKKKSWIKIRNVYLFPRDSNLQRNTQTKDGENQWLLLDLLSIAIIL